MGKTGRWNDALFAIIFTWHLATRQWPTGGTMQTIIDVLLGISAILILFKYYLDYQKNGTLLFGKTVTGGGKGRGRQEKMKNKRKK